MSDAPTLTSYDFDAESQERVTGTDLGLLVLRLMLGVIMAGHGAQKIFGWFEGAGREATAASLAQAGYPAEDTMAWITGLSEIAGGVGLAAGFLTPLAGAAVIGVLVNAIAYKWGFEFSGPISMGSPQGIEYECLLIASAAGLALAGPGRVSVDAAVTGQRGGRLGFGIGAIVLGAAAAAVVLYLRAS